MYVYIMGMKKLLAVLGNCVKMRMLIIAIFVMPGQMDAQKRIRSDSGYYKVYDTMITARCFFSQKYLSQDILGDKGLSSLKYRPNTLLTTGLGATYGWLTLNFAYGFNFLNLDDDAKGKTKSVDLQTHIVGRKISVDLFGQFYRGYYLFPSGTATAGNEKWYLRPDLKVSQIGAAGYYTFNWKRFSYRASYLNSDWQQKSAGSPLLGVELFYGKSKGDSSFVPAKLSDQYNAKGVNEMSYLDAGVGIGYAYTLVVKQNWFATASLTGSLSIDHVKEYIGDVASRRNSISPNLAYKLGIGYNSRLFTMGLSWVNNSIHTRGMAGRYIYQTGNVRLTAAYRFKLSRSTKKFLRPVRNFILWDKTNRM